MNQRFYKWKPDVPDYRDRKFSLAPPGIVPDHVDPLGLTNKVEDQGRIGSCTGNSSTTALEISLNSKTQYSRLMAYYNGRLLENNVANDDGAQIRDVIKGIQTYGIAQEAVWPYDITKFAEKPSDAAYSDGKAVIPLIDSYERLNTINDVKVALASGLGVVFGFSVPEFFEGPEVAQTGWVRMPTMFDNMVGGHAVCFTKDTKVSLLSGENLTFEELTRDYSDKQFWVYSYDLESKKIVPGLAHSPRITQKSQTIIKVTLDNGEEIKCTSLHPFLTRAGEYVIAKDLTPGDSLMPLYKKYDGYLKGYEMVFDVETKKWQYTHRVVKSEEIKEAIDKKTVHHVDFNKLK